MKIPELLFSSRIFQTTFITQLENFSPSQYKSPIPPFPLKRSFSTDINPGPACFQPVRSFPLKSCLHWLASWPPADLHVMKPTKTEIVKPRYKKERIEKIRARIFCGLFILVLFAL